MTAQLHDMEIDEISLVDDGANPGARVEIWKAKKPPKNAGAHSEPDGDENGEDKDGDGDGQTPPQKPVAKAAASTLEFDMDLKELTAALEQAEARLDTLEKAKTEAEAKVTELGEIVKAKDAQIAALEGTIAKSRTPADADEAFLKSLPEAAREEIVKARKAAADAQAELAKSREAAETAGAITKAKGLYGKAEDVGPLLLRVRKGMTTDADAAALETLLKSAGQVSSTSLLFKAMGGNDAVEGDPEAMLKAKADEIRKAKPNLTPEAAYAEALEANPSLYAASIAKRRMAAHGVGA